MQVTRQARAKVDRLMVAVHPRTGWDKSVVPHEEREMLLQA